MNPFLVLDFYVWGTGNDLPILKVKDSETLECKERIIWPACLPEKVC